MIISGLSYLGGQNEEPRSLPFNTTHSLSLKEEVVKERKEFQEFPSLFSSCCCMFVSLVLFFSVLFILFWRISTKNQHKNSNFLLWYSFVGCNLECPSFIHCRIQAALALHWDVKFLQGIAIKLVNSFLKKILR